MKSCILNYWRVVFRKVDPRYLTGPACYEMHPIHTIVLDLEEPLVYYTPLIRGRKTFSCLVPYLLLVHVGEFILYCFSLFCTRVWVGMVPSYGEGFGPFRYGLGIGGHHRQIDKNIKIFYGVFFIHSLFDNFVWIITVQSLELFQSSNHFWIDSDVGINSDLVINSFHYFQSLL